MAVAKSSSSSTGESVTSSTRTPAVNATVVSITRSGSWARVQSGSLRGTTPPPNPGWSGERALDELGGVGERDRVERRRHAPVKRGSRRSRNDAIPSAMSVVV